MPPRPSLIPETLARTRITRAFDTRGRLAPDDALYEVVCCARCGGAVATRGALTWAPLASLARPVLVASVAAALRERLDVAPEAPVACRCERPDPSAQRVAAARWCHRVVALQRDVALDVGPATDSRLALVAPLGAPRALGDAPDDHALAAALGAPLHLAVAWGELGRHALGGAPQALEVEPGHVCLAARSPADPLAIGRHAGALGDDVVSARGESLPLWSEAWDAAAPEVITAVRDGTLTVAVALSRAHLALGLATALATHGVALDLDDASGSWSARYGRFGCDVRPEALAARALAHAWSLTELIAVVADETATALARLDAWVDALARARPAVRFELVDGALFPVRPDGTRGRKIDPVSAAASVEPGTERFERYARYWCDPPPSYAPPHRVCACGAPASLSVRLVRADERPTDAISLAELRADDGSPVAATVLVVRCDEHVEALDTAGCAAVTPDPNALVQMLARDRHEERFTLTWEVTRDTNGRIALAAWGAGAGTIFLEDGWIAALIRHANLAFTDGNAPIARAFTPDTVMVHSSGFDPTALDALAGRAAIRGGWPVGSRLPFSLARTFDPSAIPVGQVRAQDDARTR